MIVGSIRAPTTQEAIALLRQARLQGADVAEIRADFVRDPDLGAIRAATEMPLVLAVRPKWEGGAFDGDEADRVALLRRGVEVGFDYVDLEFRAYKDVGAPMGRVIVSWHDFHGVPANLERLVGKMRAMEPFLVKVAVTPRCCEELLDLIELQEAQGFPVNVVAMGEWAEPLRVAYRAWGAYWTWASVGEPTAPGQIAVAELRDVYGLTRGEWEDRAVFAVVGDPVAHSRSPEVHNRMFRERGVAAVMMRWRVERAMLLPRVLARLTGAAVTLPFKQAAVEFVDRLDEDARRLGAVNTIVGGCGYNTDLAGARAALDAGGVGRGARAIVLGAGGAARAFVAALEERGAEVAVAGRSPHQAEQLAAMVLAWEERTTRPFDVVVNCTPLGMEPRTEDSPVPADFFRSGMVAIDAVYAPEETRFLREARAAGAVAVPGTVMFAVQAEAQNELFVRGLRQ